mmetsp:Transcript_14350/g.39123  ORF Transcript_14350/g.39123 Transcript_14350/m.39123 type:complete len:272 (-) Transcript_14350:721-1536(-)
MYGTNRLIRLQIRPLQLNGNRGAVTHNHFCFVLHLDNSLHLKLTDMCTESFDVGHLVGCHAGQTFALLRLLREELPEACNCVLTTVAMLQHFLREVWDLQELRTFNVQPLQQTTSKLDHGHRRKKPIAHASNLDHGEADLHGVAEQLIQIIPQLWRQEVVKSLHVDPDENLVSRDQRLFRVLRFNVQSDGVHDGLHVGVVRGTEAHGSAFGTGCQELGAIFHPRCLLKTILWAPEEVKRFYHDAIGGITLGFLVVADEGHRHQKKQEEKEH